jgi:hypothetical protein
MHVPWHWAGQSIHAEQLHCSAQVAYSPVGHGTHIQSFWSPDGAVQYPSTPLLPPPPTSGLTHWINVLHAPEVACHVTDCLRTMLPAPMV